MKNKPNVKFRLIYKMQKNMFIFVHKIILFDVLCHVPLQLKILNIRLRMKKTYLVNTPFMNKYK